MGLADAFAAAKTQPRSGYRCGVYAILEALGADAPVLQAHLDDPSSSGAMIARVLRDHGYTIHGNTIQRHRNGDCKCPREDG